MTARTCSQIDMDLTRHSINPIDGRIQHLLQEAEKRLQKQDSLSSHCPKPENPSGDSEVVLPESSRIPRLSTGDLLQPYFHHENDIAVAGTCSVNREVPKVGSSWPLLVGKRPPNNTKLEQEKHTAGSNWFNLPKTELTPEFKRDLQLLRMRSILDPKRHYKKDNVKSQHPEYSQVGTIIEGPGEFFTGRIARKDRKKTFVREALALERESLRFKSKYQGVQANKRDGKRSFYKGLQAKRHNGSK